MKALLITAALVSVAFSQDNRVLSGETVRVVPSLDHPFVGALRATYKFEGMTKDNEAPKLTASAAKYDLAIEEDISPTGFVTWNVKLSRVADGGKLADCQYFPVTEPMSELKLRERSETNQFCAETIMKRFQWVGKLPAARSVPASGFDHARWHRQINFEMDTFRERARIRRGR